MSLNSFHFVLYFCAAVVLVALLQLLRNKLRIAGTLQLAGLLLFSYFLIYMSDWRFCLCIAGVTVWTYLFGLQLEKKHKKGLLAIGIVFLVLFLGVFKYAGFFVNSFRGLFGYDSVTLNIILPLGVSFYIFSALAYLIDVYRGDYEAEKNILHFALYIAFFAKLTAGPIVRGKDFFPQIKKYRGIEWNSFLEGAQIFVFGLFKKVVLADRLGVFVDNVFKTPEIFNTGTVILAVLSYSLQIYFDFSGYSDMAIGVSKIVGFAFKPNFNLPYISQNVSEFWTRWHISLSSWFKDYLYIPLGGSRKSKIRTLINLMLVMLVSGLWHGAGWTFIVWGALYGLASCIQNLLKKQLKNVNPYVNGVITFIIVTLFWVVFRAESLPKALNMLKGIFTVHGGISQPYVWTFFAILCLTAATVFAVIRYKKGTIAAGLLQSTDESKEQKAEPKKDTINGFYPILDLSKIPCQVAFFTFCGLTLILGYFGNTAFIYGAF
ncbi:MAG: MBOAT family protein [Lachnospiraceae bacterium]|nr:MBOAT family protein [Lachnospiraceae bacterium]